MASGKLTSVFCAVRYRMAAAIVLAFGLCKIVHGDFHMAVVGNWGYPDSFVKQSAAHLRRIATSEQVSFIVSPGSNFVGGVESVDDPKWVSQWEEVFGDKKGTLRMPFFAVMGSEDWGSNVSAQIMRMKGDYEVQQKQDDLVLSRKDPSNDELLTPKWTMPNYWYYHVLHFTASSGNVITGASKTMSLAIYFVDTFVMSTAFPYGQMTHKHQEHLEKFLTIGKKIFDYIVVVGDRSVRKPHGHLDSSLSHLDKMLRNAQIDMYIAGNESKMEAFEHDNILHVQGGVFGKSGGSPGEWQGAAEGKDRLLFSEGSPGFCTVEFGYDDFKVRFYSCVDGKLVKEIVRPLKVRNKERLSPYSYFAHLPDVEYVPMPAAYLPSGEGVDFVRIVGTIGLVIGSIFFILGSMTGISRMTK